MLFCIYRYCSPWYSLLFSSYNIVNLYFYSTVDDARLRTSSFLSLLIEIRDGIATFSSNFILSYTKLCDIITFAYNHIYLYMSINL